jgi:sigma-B regulation protein RsbU (phosphoserine phosphatase)
MPDFHSEENLQAFFVPARFLGGDFYDIIDYGNHKYYIIADVSGKGLAAALYGARVKSSFQAFLQSDLPLNEVFSRVNDYLQQGNQDGFFCTLFAVQKEKQSNILHYCSAGHNNMLFIRNGQSVLLSAKGIPLGLFNGFVYSLEEMELQEGDLLFLYTDGVTEAENSDLHIFGLERIKLLIENMWQEDLSRISQSIQPVCR